ncbi:MAG: hypothetical protein Q8P41_24010 [Pseudomonadota bacterium]|nr:hypothetical protein [Pseudomonadota bacterium]
MPLPHPLPHNVVRLHPELPALTARDRARLDLVELFRGLDQASQLVLLNQLEHSQARIRRHTPAAALVRGEQGPVSWRRGSSDLWLVAPMSRRFMHQRALG